MEEIMAADSGSRDAAAGKTKGSRPKPKNRSGSMGLSARVRKLQRFLASAAWEAFGEMFGFRAEQTRPFSLNLKVVIEPGSPWRVKADPPLTEQIREAVREMATEADIYKPGRVYCYHCESSECAHSAPPRPGSVFGGYSATGLPRWPEFVQMLLELKHPKVDLLYENPGRDVAAAFVEADFLKDRQLNVFGRLSKTYDILGQVFFGFLHLRPAGNAKEAERVAFTLQAVETRRLDGTQRLELNVLGRLWDESAAIDAFKSPYEFRVSKVFSDTRRRIHQLAGKGANKRGNSSADSEAERCAAVERILRRTAHSLEQIGRQTHRRTAHAEERRVDNRPTSKAWEDAAGAAADHIYWDVHRHTVVVLGPRNRIHIFNPEGRHVTSLLLEAEAVRGRLRRGRWRPLADEALEQFSATVGRREEKPDQASRSARIFSK
jgi:hypothetical protein